MPRKKKTGDEDNTNLNLHQNTDSTPTIDKSQSASEWTDCKAQKPQLFKIVTIRTKTGEIHHNCARIPDGTNDLYINDDGKEIRDVTQWKPYHWVYPEINAIFKTKKSKIK